MVFFPIADGRAAPAAVASPTSDPRLPLPARAATRSVDHRESAAPPTTGRVIPPFKPGARISGSGTAIFSVGSVADAQPKAGIHALLEQLRTLGVDEVRVGLELEMNIPNKESAAAEAMRSEIVAELDVRKPGAKGPATSGEGVRSLKARELVMYQLIEREPGVRDALVYLAGTGDNGYYDGVNCLELKTVPLDARVLEETLGRILAARDEVLERLSLTEKSPINYHVNISFWRNGQNLFDDPEVEPRLTAGLAHAVSTAKDVLPKDFSGRLRVGNDRKATLRVGAGRLEYRPTVPPAEQSPVRLTEVLLEGAIAGLTDPTLGRGWDVQRTGRLNVEHHGMQWMAAALEGSSVDESGRLHSPDAWLSEVSWYLCYELGLSNESPDTDPELYEMIGKRNPPRYFEAVVLELLRQTRVRDGKLEFPETDAGRFVVTIPACGLHLETLHDSKDGERVRTMIARGELPGESELFHAGFDVFNIPEREWPRPEQRFVIDTAALRRNIAFRGVEHRTVCTPQNDRAKA